VSAIKGGESRKKARREKLWRGAGTGRKSQERKEKAGERGGKKKEKEQHCALTAKSLGKKSKVGM